MALNPSPQRQAVVTFPTPNVGDILFFETVDAERIGVDVPEYGTKHPDREKWPNHRLVFVESTDEQNRFYRFYYAADQLDQDDDNWSFSKADIGGTKFDSVSREYVVRRSEFDPDTPAMGSAMPDNPEDKFPGSYVLAERRQIPINDKVLNSLYVVEQRTYVKKVSLANIQFDEFFNTSNLTTETLYYATEVPSGESLSIAALMQDETESFWGLTDDGHLRTGTQLSAEWYLVRDQQVVNTGGGTTASLVSYESVNYTFPPVLITVAIDTWERRDGGFERYPRPIYSREGYSGPCKAMRTITWSKTKQAYPTLDAPPDPLPISFASPVVSVGIPASLHAAISFSLTNGTSDPVYEYTVGVYSFSATNYTDWPASLVVKADQKPFRGGWLLETLTVYSP